MLLLLLGINRENAEPEGYSGIQRDIHERIMTIRDAVPMKESTRLPLANYYNEHPVKA